MKHLDFTINISFLFKLLILFIVNIEHWDFTFEI